MESRERFLGHSLSTDGSVGLRSHPLPSRFLPGSGMSRFLLHADPESAVCQLHGKPKSLKGLIDETGSRHLTVRRGYYLSHFLG